MRVLVPVIVLVIGGCAVHASASYPAADDENEDDLEDAPG